MMEKPRNVVFLLLLVNTLISWEVTGQQKVYVYSAKVVANRVGQTGTMQLKYHDNLILLDSVDVSVSKIKFGVIYL